MNAVGDWARSRWDSLDWIMRGIVYAAVVLVVLNLLDGRWLGAAVQVVVTVFVVDWHYLRTTRNRYEEMGRAVYAAFSGPREVAR